MFDGETVEIGTLAGEERTEEVDDLALQVLQSLLSTTKTLASKCNGTKLVSSKFPGPSFSTISLRSL
jgi:hypothetical protein